MSYKTINTKYITIFFGAFLIGGLLHVALYGIDFFDCISQMYYSAMALVWAVTIQKRVSDRRIRNRLLVTVSLMLLMFMLQICSYKLLGEELNPRRYSWYGYYIPVILPPFFIYRIAILVGTGADSERGIKLRKKPSIGQWFLNDLLCLSDIKVPASVDPWA